LRLRTKLQNRYSKATRYGYSRRPQKRLNDQRACLEIGQIKIELLGAVTRVQGRGRGARGNTQKRACHIRAIRQYQHNPVVAPQAKTIQVFAYALHLRGEGA